jgi:circadian clock protein KaiC
MTDGTATTQPGLSRVPTGLPGLDRVTGGGLLQAGVYILQGRPGAGKTILANQICYHHVAHGGRVAYVTMLAESHARLLQHLQRLSFYDESAVPDSIHYVSGFDALRTDGLQGMIALLRGEIRTRRATVLVLDGLVTAAGAAGTDEALKVFISEIQAHAALTGCTTLLLASGDPDEPAGAEQTMVDGIVLMRESEFGPRRERHLEVRKFRGSDTLRGTHAFDIGADGVAVYPRLESAFASSPAAAIRPLGVTSGVDDVDRAIEAGGFPQHSVTAVAGYSGCGKTTLALHFLARSTAAAPGIYFSFFESPEFLVDIADRFGSGLRAAQAAGAVEFIWYPYGENGLDEMAYRLLARVRARGAKRVAIDGLGGFLAAPAYPDRGPPFFAALTNELRRLGATTLVTTETSGSPLDALPVPTAGLSALADNLVRLHLDDRDMRIRRYLSIHKMRGATYDQRIRELVLTTGGLRLEPRAADATASDGP